MRPALAFVVTKKGAMSVSDLIDVLCDVDASDASRARRRA